jgi:uncharacterized protein YjdB
MAPNRKYRMNILKRYTKLLVCSVGFLGAALVAGCGGGGDQGRDPILGVPAAVLVSIAVTPAVQTVAIGATQQFTATASYSDGSARDVTPDAAWSSAETTVATVNASSGIAVGVAGGDAAITAAFEGKSGSAMLKVSPAQLASLAVTPKVTTFQTGATRQLAAFATYSDGSVIDVTAATKFVSATPAAVTVSNTGLMAGVAPGTSDITASFDGQTDIARATTTNVTLSRITVSPANATIAVGGTQQFVAVATYSDNSTAVITRTALWTSAAEGTAKVQETGAATGVAAGTTTITASANGQSASANLTVTATATAPAPAPAPAPAFNSVNLGSAANFGVLAGTSLTNNSGGTTFITGDVGSPSQTTDPVQAPGYNNYKSGAILDNALADLQTAITDAKSRTCDVSFAGDVDLGGDVLPPGVYCYAGAISVTGTLTLSGPGVYIFRTELTLDTTANAVVALTNGATADNVTWVPVGPSTLGANGAFKGSILGQSAAITVGDNTTLLNGRVLSAAAVTLRNNQITK